MGVPPKTPRLSLRRPFTLAGIGAVLCAAAWTAKGIYLFWNDPKLVNFLAAWIPTVGSIVVAFVPEHEMSPAKKYIWRSSVILVGFAWSLVLWHQQVVTESTSLADQQRIVGEAVTQSNAHSDDQLGKLKTDMHSGLAGTASKDDLTKTTAVITDSFSKSQTELAGKIERITPKPAEVPKLELSIYGQDVKPGSPLLTKAIVQDKDGNFSADVLFTNVSEVPAEDLDVWLQICDACFFAAEPNGMDKPLGIQENTRHMHVPIMKAGATFQTMSLLIKTALNPPVAVRVGFRYACKSCGTHGTKETQAVTFTLLPKPLS